jgi:Skp family chaperone for outer membrane proteins
MTIRFLAEELYRLTKKVEHLEAALASLDENASLEERARLEAELLQARKEREHLKAVLESKKEKPLI